MKSQINTLEFALLFDRAYSHHISGNHEAEKVIWNRLNSVEVVFEPDAYAWFDDPGKKLEEDLLLQPPMAEAEMAWAWAVVHKGFNR